MIQIKWLNVASKFFEYPLQHPDVIDLEVMTTTTENELRLPVDVVKQTFTNYMWLFHQRYLRRREFSLQLIHPHSSQVIPLNFDDNWADILTAGNPKEYWVVTIGSTVESDSCLGSKPMASTGKLESILDIFRR